MEIGWGQWTSPASTTNELCTTHPLRSTCRMDEDDNGILEECRDATDLAGLAECNEAQECRQKGGKNGVGSSLEGGLGYWPYFPEKPQVAWMVPGATTDNYARYSGTIMPAAPTDCFSLGAAVRISNRLLVPNDVITFKNGANSFNENSFLGFMVNRTPIGKRGPKDKANYWTFVADAENFAGPILYSSAYFWDQRKLVSSTYRSADFPSIRQSARSTSLFVERRIAEAMRLTRVGRIIWTVNRQVVARRADMGQPRDRHSGRKDRHGRDLGWAAVAGYQQWRHLGSRPSFWVRHRRLGRHEGRRRKNVLLHALHGVLGLRARLALRCAGAHPRRRRRSTTGHREPCRGEPKAAVLLWFWLSMG